MGKANGNYRHGRFTSDAIERRRSLNALIRMLGKTAQEVVQRQHEPAPVGLIAFARMPRRR